ncbi:hypothetical protein DAEQUDRAFT_142914 [Daedalea quercina L-15889]|uniref:Uncharacterized protein n=1 Tax=Daedalea quercina L-15889 TaxID=1314783 RepID=A0A165RVR5_9APHY|nr:hypothetical protein DAEQUDRAFT_142914 [Daedalea quercina L-15889]
MRTESRRIPLDTLGPTPPYWSSCMTKRSSSLMLMRLATRSFHSLARPPLHSYPSLDMQIRLTATLATIVTHHSLQLCYIHQHSSTPRKWMVTTQAPVICTLHKADCPRAHRVSCGGKPG